MPVKHRHGETRNSWKASTHKGKDKTHKTCSPFLFLNRAAKLGWTQPGLIAGPWGFKKLQAVWAKENRRLVYFCNSNRCISSCIYEIGKNLLIIVWPFMEKSLIQWCIILPISRIIYKGISVFNWMSWSLHKIISSLTLTLTIQNKWILDYVQETWHKFIFILENLG